MLDNLFISLVIEIPIYILGFLVIYQNILLKLNTYFFLILINIFTLPIAYFLYHQYQINFYVLELSVISLEGILCFLYFKISVRTAFVLAFLSNLVSAFAYLVI